MKPMFAAVLVAATVVAGTVSVVAAEPTAPKPIVVKDKVTVKATVEAIDSTNRTVTLKGSKGEITTVAVDESVDRFDAIKVGDTVTAEYYESVVYEVQKPGAAPAPESLSAGAGKFEGEKPGGAVMAKTVTTVTIEAIDLATPAVTIKTADGAIQSFRVRKKKNLEGLKVGDRVQVTQTSALAIAVDPAK